MVWISAGSGWSGRSRLNLAAMMTRRSLAVMSAVDGSVFEVYQGASGGGPGHRRGGGRRWRSSRRRGAWQASMNGIVRSTTRAVRLRLARCRTTAFAPSIAASPVFCLSRMRMTVTGTAPTTEYHRQVNACPTDGLGLAVAGERDLQERRSGGGLRKAGHAVAFLLGRPLFPVRSGGRSWRAALLRNLVVQVTPSGNCLSSSRLRQNRR